MFLFFVVRVVFFLFSVAHAVESTLLFFVARAVESTVHLSSLDQCFYFPSLEQSSRRRAIASNDYFLPSRVRA